MIKKEITMEPAYQGTAATPIKVVVKFFGIPIYKVEYKTFLD